MSKTISSAVRILGNRRPSFEISASATGCAIILAAAYAPSVHAQAAPAAAPPADDQLQEVVVSGIRRSIQDSIATKKNNEDIVDVVSAEEMGKLPDFDIADSIARLPGVSEQLDQFGKGTAISIRGFGPDFVGMTLNGRDQTSAADTRSVDYSAYPGELVSKVVVYKTPDAGLIGQGLAGTVDIRTTKPLDSNGLQIAANVRTEELGRELSSVGHGNRQSLSFVDQFFDHTIGVAAGIARLDDKSGLIDNSGSWGAGPQTLANGTQVTLPYGGMNLFDDKDELKRTGAVGVLQFKPNDRLESELDVFYSRFQFNDAHWGLQLNLSAPQSSCYGYTGTLPCDINNPNYSLRQPAYTLGSDAVINNGVLTSGTVNDVRALVRNEGIGSDQLLHSFGWGTTYKVTDTLSLNFDVNLNDVKNQNYDIETYASSPQVTGAGVPVTTSVTFRPGSLNISNPANIAFFSNPSNLVFTDVYGWGGGNEQPGYIKYPLVKDKMAAFKLDGKLDFVDNSVASALEFGLNYSDRSKENDTTEGYLNIKGTNGAYYANGSNLPGGDIQVAGDSGIGVPTYNVYNQWSQFFDISNRITPNILAKVWEVDEKLTTLYGKFDIKSQVGGIPVRGNAGVQIVNAKQSSSALATYTLSTGDVNGSPPVYQTLGATRTDILPSANLTWDFAEGRLLRTSLARQMVRPNMEDMNGTVAIATGTGPNGGTVITGSSGNPALKPFLADAVDISLEKYFGNKALLSLAGFYKHLESFITQATVETDFSKYGVALPSGVNPVGLDTEIVNGSGGRVMGYEANAVLPLDTFTPVLNGFGVEANLAITSSTVVSPAAGLISPTVAGASGAGQLSGSGATTLPGLSRESAKATVYYERFGFSARASYNYRSQFIGAFTNNFGVPGVEYVAGYGLMDAQLSYHLPTGPLKGLELQLQGVNLLNTAYRTYTNSASTASSYTVEHFGQTLMIGLNYKY